MIYTTYFANVKNLPSNIIPISIAGKAPKEWNGLEYKKLAPKWSFFSVWKETQDNDYYIEHFQKEVLDKITILQVMRDLIDLSLPTDLRHPSPVGFALVCYESSEKFCHRHLVADWLNKNGVQCKEWEDTI